MNNKPIRAAIYARISTAGQQSIPAQLEAMREYCARRGWSVVREVSETRSGVKRRPERDALMAAARARELDAIVVVQLARFGRSLHDLAGAMYELTELGVTFVSINDGIDLSTASGRALAGMLATFAQFERDLLIERVRAGVAHAKRNGTRSGKPFGRPPVARSRAVEILAMRHAGTPISVIATKTGVSRTSINRVLSAHEEAIRDK